jgi:hypothetical protein
VTGSPASSGDTPSYVFKNVRYNSYISPVTPPRGYFYLTQSNKSTIFYARGANGGYLEVLISVGYEIFIIAHGPYRFSPDRGLSVFWDVPDEIDVVGLEAVSSKLI